MYWGPRCPNSTTGSHQLPEALVREEFNLEEGFVPQTGLQKCLQRKVGDWKVCYIFLAFVRNSRYSLSRSEDKNAQGQIIAASSYQITLVTSARGESAKSLCSIVSSYLAATIFWWYLHHRAEAFYVLSCLFFLYGAAFFLVGMAHFLSNLVGRGWMYNIAKGIYAVVSASNSFFLALNFGTEGTLLNLVLTTC